MKKNLSFLLVLIILLISACTTNLLDHNQMVGNWHCVEIIDNNKNTSAPLGEINFEFNADSTYTYYSKDKNSGQTGTWYTLEDKLYTTPEGGKKMAVKLGLTSDNPSSIDTLLFYQNRGGVPEVWKMARQ